MRRIWITLIGIGVSSLAFAQKADFSWLVGSWEIKTEKGVISESWQQVNDSTLTGVSLFVVPSGERIPQESLELRLREGVWQYVSTVEGQNNNKPVAFKLKFIGKMEFISENPQHDFPQRIAYRRVGSQLYASIEGVRKGKYTKQNFDFQLNSE